MPDVVDPPAPPQKPTRRRLVVNLSFQAYLAGVMTLFVLFGTGAVLGEYYYQYGRSMASNLMDPGLFFLFIRSNTALLVKLIGFLVMVVGISIIISNRISGPLYRLERCFEGVAKGDLRQRLLLRRRDHLKETAAQFNAMMEALHRLAAEDRAAADALATELEALGRAGLAPEAMRILESAKLKTAALTRRLEI